jgi:hypothetical protein
MTDRIVRIGGASGAWGDSPLAIGQLLEAGVDYLMMDYLAEVTMSLLARARMKDPQAGYPPDFVGYLKPHLATVAQTGVKVVSNAGGVNPQACQRALQTACEELGLNLRVAVVLGDDLMPQLDVLRAEGVREATSGETLPEHLLTANAYLGAIPIAQALARGADIVVTGRCADSALALGILMHEFGWLPDQHDLLAAGSLVGHILECGPQATGGVFTDWERVPDWHRIGYPIALCHADGSFELTKPTGTGGLIDVACVAEQVLYEVGDPRAYLLPDVVADFSQVTLEQVDAHHVRVRGACGRPPTTQYKVSSTWQDGWRAVAMVVIVGVDAVRKAERTAAALIDRAQMLLSARGLPGLSRTHVEVLGGESSYGERRRARDAREVVLRLVVEHPDAKALNLFARELGSAGLSFAQGTAALVGGRPKAVPVVRLFTCFVDKHRLPVQVQVGEAAPVPVTLPAGQTWVDDPLPSETLAGSKPDPMVEVPLLRVAHARSGDKGDSSNIAIICREPRYWDHLRQVLTAQRVAEHFSGVIHGSVQRYEAPGIHAFNFLMTQALGGGGMASMRIDSQGKAYGQRALEMKVPVPAHWIQPSH